MLRLFIKTGCPYCAKVQGFVGEQGIEVEECNISDEACLQELLEKGGQRQVPFLIDEEAGVSMYESDDIIVYLEGKTGGAATAE